MPIWFWIIITALISIFITGIAVHTACYKTVGKLTVDLSGENNPVSIDLTNFTNMMDQPKYVVLRFKLILPEENEEGKLND